MQCGKLVVLCLAGFASGAIAQDDEQASKATRPEIAQVSEGQALTRADFIQQMDVQFARLDADGNGMILEEEVASSQRRVAEAEALRQNRLVFSRLDTDDNGVISLDEFAALANPEAIPINGEPFMKQFDTDKDGVITLIEYRIATQSNFDRIDSDRDGTVTQIEMRAAGISH